METDAAPVAGAITDLLLRAKHAHGIYEATELNGVYDEDWPRWYADWAIENGLAEIIGHPAPLDRVAQLLESGFAEYDRAAPKPDESWAAYLGRRLADEL